MQLLSQ